MNKNYNNLLFLGLFIVVVGIFLFVYSFSSYMEVKNLSQRIDFDDLDNNNYVSTNDRYYKYLSIGEFLNAKLEKNKKLPIKHTACVYLDYAQHNVLSEYKLIFNSSDLEDPRKDVVEANIKRLDEMLDNYTVCKNTSTYKAELQNTLDKIAKSVDLYETAQQRMDNFLNSGGEIERVLESPEYKELEPAPQENAIPNQEPAIPQVIEEGNTY